ncbi:MAG: SDR family NAD(P)-dependent oxidoreductase [Candidatus Omnitrophica bacterium]|nr:SDR family NAD(P)-dependent oxidoreductase [Candidatus Omnitrophota bacterium]
MSEQLFNKLEKFRKKQKLSINALCRELGTSNNNYYRWKQADKIAGPYRNIIEKFLGQNETNSKKLNQISSDIAVIGVACHYPGAKNINELWENILSRRVEFRRMLDQRLPLNEYYDEKKGFPDKTYLTKAAFIDGFDFNWSQLRIPKQTFESTDIVHWLALDTALRTFEDAGYKSKDIPFYQSHKIPIQNTGVILGNTLTGEQTRSMTLRLRWPYVRKTLGATLQSFGIVQEERARITEAMEKVYKSAFFPITEDTLAGGLANTIAGRICNYFNFKGGGYIVDGACSSSLLAVATAANALRLREMDLVLAGGVDVSLDPFELVGFSKVGALAKDEMRVYDQRASGFIPGEGCGFVLLKRLEDAVRDKDYIYAVIKGWGISSDGKGGIMEPSSSGQATAIQRAYNLAGYTLADVDFVEGHGTGTTKGDKVELAGIAASLKQATKRTGKRMCGITSFKSIVGHTKAAAGIGGFIKAVLAVNQRVLPPTANCHEPNEIFENEAKQLYPLIHGKICPSNKTVRAGVSSAGFGGINCHITIESKSSPKGTLKSKIKEDALFSSNQNTEIFVFASRTLIHLDKLIKKFKEELRNISMAEMADLSARLNKKVRVRDSIKVAVVTDSPEHLYEALNAIENELDSKTLEDGQMIEIKSKDPITFILLGNNVRKNRIGFLYAGQGAQRLNMTRTLVNRFDWAKDLLNMSKVPLKDYIYKNEDQCLTNEEKVHFQNKLSQTEITQPAITFSSVVWTEFLSKLGIDPDAVGGHSLGELTAFYKAGAFDRNILFKFSEFRGKQMSGKGKSAGMVSLSCDYENARELVSKVKGNAVISNINSPIQTVVSGDLKEIDKVISLAKKQNISTLILPVSNAFHSSLMRLPSRRISSTKILNGIYNPKKTNLYSCIDGKLVQRGTDIKEYFAKQVLEPVNFIKLIESMSKQCDLFIEVGPGRILTDLTKAINGDNDPPCFPIEGRPQSDRDLNVVLAQTFVRNVKVNWKELYSNRAIKPFIPTSRKKFIENQCERPLKALEQQEILVSEVITPAYIEKLLEPTRQLDHVLVAPDDGEGASIAKILLDLTHKMTGFDKESINLNMRLLDDLNLDSIKAAELIAEAAKALGVAGEIEPAQYSNKTMNEIKQKFEVLLAQKQDGSRVDRQDSVLKRYQNKAWVRNFVERFESQNLKEDKTEAQKIFKNILLISDLPKGELSEFIKEEFKGSKVRIINPDEIDFDKKPECVISILRSNANDRLTLEALQERMEKFHKIITLAANAKYILFAQLGSGDFKESSIRALASTLHLERPELYLKIIDFNKNLKNKFIAEKICRELKSSTVFAIAGYNDKGERRSPVFEVSNSYSYKKRNIVWSKKDVVLITGGAKGITAECALEFGRITKVKVMLVGRSKKDEGIEKTLERFRQENLECAYFQCDVSDAYQVKKVVIEIEKRFGLISAVVHGAGLNSLRRLKQTNLEDVYKEVLPKIMGAVNLLDVLKGSQLKLFVPIASIIGVTGMEGSGWYGFANEMLLLCVRAYKNKNENVQIIAPAFSVWDEVGMGVNLGSIEKLAEKGIGAIPVDEGVKRFCGLIEGDPSTDHVIITSRVPGLNTFQVKDFDPRPNLRFIEEINYHMPGVELIVQTHLNVQDDPYLLDHNWKGTILFPFVFGLEAMVQAASYLTNDVQIESLMARDIHLDKPIPINLKNGTRIEIHAQILEESSKADSKVKVEIFSEHDNYNQPAFFAILNFSKGEEKLKTIDISKDLFKNPINFNVDKDVYGPILFQGKTFQCINKVYKLFFDQRTDEGECIFTTHFEKSTATFLKQNRKFSGQFLINDPFLIDSSLQSMQIIAAQDACLPNFIKELRLDISAFSKYRDNLLVKTNLKKCGMTAYSGNSFMSDGKVIILSIIGCHLKILESLPGNPSANDLVDPNKRDMELIERKLNSFTQNLNGQVPAIKYVYDPRFKNAHKDKRHELEIPYLHLLLQQILDKKNKNLEKIKIKWESSGRPIVETSQSHSPNISISHTDASMICVAGYSQQGCDIENIIERKENDWLALLGENKHQLLERMIKLGFDLNTSGTAIWSAVETFKKTLNKKQVNIRLCDYWDDVFIFENDRANPNIKVVSIPIKFTIGDKKVLSFAIEARQIQKEKKDLFEKKDLDKSVLTKFGFNEELFGIHVDYSGPQQQYVFSKHFPVTFRTNKLMSRRVFFTSYFEWMGELREYSIQPVMSELANLLETGGWGLATNGVRLKILGDLRGNDVILGRVWMEEVSGEKESIFDLCFEWRKQTNSSHIERVAFCKQRVSWIKITGHGQGKVEEMPPAIKSFMDSMRPRTKVKQPLEKFSEPFNHLNSGNIIKEFDNKGLFLMDYIFDTSLENSNLVGNVYFANYAEWLGVVMDLYFYKIIPECYKGVGDNGEFVILNCDIDYLTEAMPFDTILVKMYLNRIHQNSLDLDFEFFLYNGRKVGRKLAAARNRAIWVRRKGDIVEAENLPSKLIQNFQKQIIEPITSLMR